MVTRCVCADVSLAELIELARREGLGYEGLSARTGCGGGCGLCEPYVRLALRTGKPELPVLSAAEIAEIMRAR